MLISYSKNAIAAILMGIFVFFFSPVAISFRILVCVITTIFLFLAACFNEERKPIKASLTVFFGCLALNILLFKFEYLDLELFSYGIAATVMASSIWWYVSKYE